MLKNKISLNIIQVIWLLVLFITLVIQLAGFESLLRFDRQLIIQGDYWLLLSGHFVHLNWAHWSLNMAGLAIVAFFFSAYGTVLDWLFVVFVSALFVGFGLLWLNPSIGWYVGLSGVLHGLFLFGVLNEIKAYPMSGKVLLVLIIGKLLWERFNGALPGSEDMVGGSVITDAHLYGAVGGLLSTLLLVIIKKYKA